MEITDHNTCPFVAVRRALRASITRACQTQRSASLSCEKGDFYLTKRGPTTINRARETTKRRVLLPRELLDTLLANGSRRLAPVSYCCVVGKIDVVRERCSLPFACLYFSPGQLFLPFRTVGVVFFLSLLFYFFLFHDVKSTT